MTGEPDTNDADNPIGTQTRVPPDTADNEYGPAPIPTTTRVPPEHSDEETPLETTTRPT